MPPSPGPPGRVRLASAPKPREREVMDVYRAEYIWIDGTQPTQKLRSKTKIVPAGEEPLIWAFDGSSTQQATGDKSDCVLQPVFVVPDPIRGEDNKLVLCEVMLVSAQPHPTNQRRANVEMAERFEVFDTWFGIEQEYTFFEGSRPLGFPDTGFPAPQGGYYCGVGADEVFGRDVVEAHLDACLRAGLKISGINAEVMPGQWEFQVGPVNAPEVGDQLWVARWLLYRVGEDYGVSATLYPKPVRGDWNGAGAHPTGERCEAGHRTANGGRAELTRATVSTRTGRLSTSRGVMAHAGRPPNLTCDCLVTYCRAGD